MTIKLLYGTAIVTMLSIAISTNSALSAERVPHNIPASLALKIGKRLHLSQKQGCATCHNVDGTGGKKAGAANLQTPSKWKSTLIAKKVNDLGVQRETTRSIAVGLILNGAEKWNAVFYDKPNYSNIDGKIFFDKRMIGVHSTALKMNQRMAKRMLKKGKKRVPSKELLKVMAESVYLYMNDNIFVISEKK